MARMLEHQRTGDAASQLSTDRPADMMSGDVNYDHKLPKVGVWFTYITSDYGEDNTSGCV